MIREDNDLTLQESTHALVTHALIPTDRFGASAVNPLRDVKPLGPSIHQVRKFNSGVNSQVNSILNDDRRYQAGETREINSGVRSDINGARQGNRKTNMRGDIRNLNNQADIAQRRKKTF
uniref:PU-F2 n=1 Tax=Pinctada fucata TaxID=50426 RepID=A0A0P0LJN1_PINFU|nr:PU-F2 [Pinctada fucata]